MKDDYRIMIIDYKWVSSDEFTAPPSFIERKDINDEILKTISSNKRKLYDEYTVYEQDDRNNSILAKIIRINTKRGSETAQFFARLAESYRKKTSGDIYAFLHRGIPNNHAESCIWEIKKHTTTINNFFLFGDGKDYIYGNTQGFGLILNGIFHHKRDGTSTVVDESRKLIYQKSFERVWKYYKYEAKRKYFELSEKLMSCLWLYFYSGDSEENLLKYLNTQKELLPLMYQSFNQEKKNKKILEGLEVDYQKSFTFDDCNQNLSNIEQQPIYQDIRQLMSQDTFSLTKKHLSDINKKFDKLIQSLDGPIYS